MIASSSLLRLSAVIRRRVLLGTALALGAIIATLASAQRTDEEKRKPTAHTKAREEMHAVVSPTPAETPDLTPKPRPAKRRSKNEKQPIPQPTATRMPRKGPTPESDESPSSKSKAKSGTKKASEADETPKPKQADKTDPSESPEPTRKPGAGRKPTPEPNESPAVKRETKSGTEKLNGEDQTPKPKLKEKADPNESPVPTRKPGARKTPTAESDESPTPKAKAKSGTQKSGKAAATSLKRKQSRKTHANASPKPARKRRARQSPSPKPDESPIPEPAARKKADVNGESAPKRIEKAEPAKTPTPIEKPLRQGPESIRTPVPEPSAHPRPASTPPLSRAPLPSDITIEKSGFEKEQGLEPVPPPPPRRGFWPWSRQPANYRYLTSATIDAIRRAPVQRARWKFIIVHNSGTRQGNARAFDYYHRKVRRMRNGLAYHFVIGNGTSSGNGQIEIGDRWRRQINGGHVHSDYMNNIGLGICLVGDFNRDQPTRAQLDACDELIRYLRERCGKSDGQSLIVRPHREVNPPRWATDCPGDAFPYGWFSKFR